MSTRSSLQTQAGKFIISGAISAVVDLGLTWVLQIFFGAGPVLARSVGFIFGTITAYLINVRWTFKTKSSPKQVLAVAALYLITYATQVGIFTVLNPGWWSRAGR